MYLKGFIHLIKIFVIIGIPVFLALFILYNVFNLVQESTFLTKLDFFLIQNKHLEEVFLFFGLIFFLIIGVRVESGKYFHMLIIKIWKFKILPLIIIAVVAFIASLSYFFYSYTIVSTNGITYRDGPQSNVVFYKWNEVKEINVFSLFEEDDRLLKRKRSLRMINKLHYIIVAKDNIQFDLKQSKNFWYKILDFNDFAENNNIIINKGTIKHDECLELLLNDSQNVDFMKGYKILKQIMIVEKMKYGL